MTNNKSDKGARKKLRLNQILVRFFDNQLEREDAN